MESWPKLHGGITHFPIALIVVAFLFELGSVLFKKPEWRVVSFWSLVAGVVGGVGGLISGWIAADELYRGVTKLPAIVLLHRTRAFVASGLAVIVLIWRIVAKDRFVGAALYGALTLLFLSTAVVLYTGYLGGQMVFGGQTTGVTNAVPSTNYDPKLIAMGSKLYTEQGCANCHGLAGKGGGGGPELTNEAVRQPDINWQIAHIKDPAKMKPGSSMPPYASLTAPQLKALATYVLSDRK